MRWEELSVAEIETLDREATVLLLPLGSVEQHGRHLPVGTDSILAAAVSREAAKLIPRRVVVLPPPWYGLSQHHMRFAGTVTLRAETMMGLVEDIAQSVVAHGFRRLVLVNGHGGNAGLVDVVSAKLGHQYYGRARVAGLTYFQLARETAMMQYVRPDLVDMKRATVTYPNTGSAYVSTDLLIGSRVRTYNDFGDLSESGILGDPSLASPEAGARFHEAVVEELVRFIEEFSRWPIQRSR
jgi:creatinine amidohydrolase